ncbi:MAG: tetratricopeptide repeat protein [Gemmatimonas sp.]
MAVRSTTFCAIAALAVGLAGCAATPEPARTAQATARLSEASTADALARIAQKSLAAGDPVSAVSMLKRAHAINPDSPAILAELGRTLSSLKAWSEAADAYGKAAALAPQDAGIRRGHAAALLALDLPALAEHEYREAVALREDAATLCGLGVTLDLQGRHDDAVTAFRRALELDPDGVATRANLALSLALWGESNEAIALLAPVAASADAEPRQRQNLALVFGIAGDVDQARAVARIDLPEEAVRSNLTYYETLRALPPVLRTRAMMGADMPKTAGQTTTAATATAAADAPTPAATPKVAPKSAPAKASRTAVKKTPAKPAEVAKAEPTPELKLAKTAPAIEVPVVAEAIATEAPAPEAPAKADPATADDAVAMEGTATSTEPSSTAAANDALPVADTPAPAIPEQEASVPPEAEHLPAVTIRAMGVPVATAPQTSAGSDAIPAVTASDPSAETAPPAVTTPEAPATDGAPTNLLPQKQAATDPTP